MSERDFKGVWIPKEIWLDDSLTLLEKCIFTEIDSLDNENHCIAGNEYFAEFCNCSESKISKAIKKLQELGMIEVMSFDGRHRKIRVVKNAMQSSKKCYADSQKVQAINIDNNTSNKVISKDINIQNSGKSNFIGSAKKSKQPSLYSRCMNQIDNFILQNKISTNSTRIRDLLATHLDIAFESKSIRGEKQYVGILNKLQQLVDEGDKYQPVIQYSIEHGYPTFYSQKSKQRKSYNSNAVNSESGKRHVESFTKEDERRLNEFQKECKKKGIRTTF